MKIDTSKLRALVKSRGHTNAKLADLAGITRQALHGMLRTDQVVEVRDRTVKGLVQAMQLPDASVLSPDPLIGYKEAIADENADLTFRGLGQPTTEPRSMDELYVQIRVVRNPTREREHDCRPQAADAEEELTEDPEPLTVADCLALHRRALISGEPGSGKTTALRHAARICARGLVPEGRSPGQPSIPLMVPLAEFAKARERDNDLSLLRFVVTRAFRVAAPEYRSEIERDLERQLKNGNCLVLFDGLDEIGGDGNVSRNAVGAARLSIDSVKISS